MATSPGVPRLPEQFQDYERFRDWLFESFPEHASTTAKGNTFRDFVISLVPETARGRPFGQLKPSEKQSHDHGVDVISANPDPPVLALQSKLTIREKGDIDDIISKFHAYEVTLVEAPQMSLMPGEKEPPRPVFAIATSSRLRGILSAYEGSGLTSRSHYQRLKDEHRLLIWDGDDLLRDAQQVISRRYEIPLRVELASVTGWHRSGSVLVGVVRGSDVAALEEEHGPGLFFENVRGWKGLEPVKDDETVNEAIKKTIVEAPGEMLARNNGITFRAAHVEPSDDGRLILHSASIVNGRQTTGCLADVPDLAPECEVFVKVVEASGDAWPIATAANNQNTVARIDLRLARYFREQLVQRELVPAGGSADWLRVVEGLRSRQADFDHLRYLFIGLFCRRPNQLADDNYSHIRFDILDAFFGAGEPPADLYPTLFSVVKATNSALSQVEGLGDSDPLAKIHGDNRPKYRAYLGILALCGSHRLDLSEQLNNLDEEIERITTWLSKTAQLLAMDGRMFDRNFSLAYEVAGMHALDAYENGSDLRIQQRLSDSVFHTAFSKLYRQLQYRLELEERRRNRA